MTSGPSTFQQARLADAAYAICWDNNLKQVTSTDSRVTNALMDEGMSHAQASAFVSQWQEVDQLPNTESGSSAPILQNTNAGRYEFAIRGSESLFSYAGAIDWFSADLGDTSGKGPAMHQALDLYKYRQSLNAGAGQATALAARWTEVDQYIAPSGLSGSESSAALFQDKTTGA